MANNELSSPVAWLTGEYVRISHTFIQREVRALRREGFDVRTFSIRQSGAEDLIGPEEREEAAQTFYVLAAARRPGTALRAHAAALFRSPSLWARMLHAAWRTARPGMRGHLYGLIYFHEAVVLARELRSQGIAHLHNHFAMASCTVARLAAPLAGVTWSFTVHGPDDLADPIAWQLRDKVAEASFVVCISSFARSQIMLHSEPADWEKLHIVHCGVAPQYYERVRTNARDHLLFVGRLATAKGMPVLLRALAQARTARPNLRLTVVGDGPDRGSLEDLAKHLGIEDMVTFLGYRSQQDVAQLLAGCSALVLPSFAEGVPVVLMEAMASGIPVVASRITGIPELVEDHVSGRLVTPGEEGELARGILEVLEDEEAANRMAAAGRLRVKAEFDVQTEARRIARLVLWTRAGGPRPERRP